ncbi:VC0807 family protein [Streptomyces nogalater]
MDILLPLLVYYAARALGADQAPALLLSGAPPALRLLADAVRHRRIDGVDLFLTVLLAAAALVSLIGGGPRVLLFKNAALPLAVGAWALGTAFTQRPLAFQLGQRLHRATRPAPGPDSGRTAPLPPRAACAHPALGSRTVPRRRRGRPRRRHAAARHGAAAGPRRLPRAARPGRRDHRRLHPPLPQTPRAPAVRRPRAGDGTTGVVHPVGWLPCTRSGRHG